jgi:tripartite-type tricarboxylate transporter receptor subunit TctC
MDRRQVLAGFGATTLLGLTGAKAQGAFPSKAVELVTHNVPGAVLDVMCRLISDICRNEKLFPQPLTVINKPGSGGGASFGYVMEKKGDAHTVLATPQSNIISLPLTQKVPYTWKSFTPIANLVTDGSMLFVRSDSPWKTFDDLVADSKKKPGELNVAVSSMIATPTLNVRQVMHAKDLKWELVNFAAVPEAVIAVLNGTAQIGFANPANIREHVRAGAARVLLTASLQRFPGELNAPTLEELDLGTSRVSYRTFFGPPDMPAAAADTLADLLLKVMDTKQFKDYMAKNYMIPTPLRRAALTPVYEKLATQTEGDLRAAGVL